MGKNMQNVGFLSLAYPTQQDELQFHPFSWKFYFSLWLS
jgi:hypothetical protein